jgi:hypothetical protein
MRVERTDDRARADNAVSQRATLMRTRIYERHDRVIALSKNRDAEAPDRKASALASWNEVEPPH